MESEIIVRECPFCGRPALQHTLHGDGAQMPLTYGVVRCPQLCADAQGQDVADAAARWNTRPIEDALTARLAAAERLLRKHEWVQTDGERYWICPECRHFQGRGHRDDCELAAFLTNTPAPPRTEEES